MFKKILYFCCMLITIGAISTAYANDYVPTPAAVSQGVEAIHRMDLSQRQRSSLLCKSLLSLAQSPTSKSLIWTSETDFPIKFSMSDVMPELCAHVGETSPESEKILLNAIGYDNIIRQSGDIGEMLPSKSLQDLAVAMGICPPGGSVLEIRNLSDVPTACKITKCGEVCKYSPKHGPYLEKKDCIIWDSEANRKIAILLLKIYLNRSAEFPDLFNPSSFSSELREKLQ